MDDILLTNDPNVTKRERRKAKRRGPRSGATFAYDQSSYLVGKIISISETGLSFEYSGRDQRTSDTMQIDILNSANVLPHLTKIECRMVYDITGLSERQSFSGAAVRRCGVEFLNLDEDQQSDILELMET